MNRLCLVSMAMGLTACASTSAAPAFRDASALVANRTGQRIVWADDPSASAAVEKNIRALLKNELTVDSAVAIALLGNRELQATYEDLQIGQADLVQAGLLKNPVFGAYVAFPVVGVAARGFALSITEDFLELFTIAARKRIAAIILRATTLRVADAVLRVAVDVEAAFFRLQAAQQVVAMRATIADAGGAVLDLAERQRAAGNINDLDLSNQAGLFQEVRADLVRSEGDVVVARENLTRLLGLWGKDASYRVAEKLPELPYEEPPLESLEGLAIARRLDLRASHEEAEALSQALAMAKNTRWIGSPSAGAVFERSPEGYSLVSPQASIELPIFDQKQATVARLEGELRAALAREAGLAIAIRSEVREASGRLALARSMAKQYADVIVPLREHIVLLSQQQYDSMLLGVYPLVVARQNEVNAYREFIEALRDYWIARADLKRAIAGALPEPNPRAKS